MSLKKCKVYNDGSHYIAIRHTEGKGGKRTERPPEQPIIVEDEQCEIDMPEIQIEGVEESDEVVAGDLEPIEVADNSGVKGVRVSTRADEFLLWYRQSVGMSKYKRKEFIAGKLRPYFDDDEALYGYIDYKMKCRFRAEVSKRIRCSRRAKLHGFNWFCTFTYDSKKLSEEEFKKKLLNTLRHFANRKDWKYMGTWERGGDTDRLHFHAVMYIPRDKMSGNVEKKREYDVKQKKMVEYTENSFFKDRFGRNTFDEIDGNELTISKALDYILKYIEKDGGRIICSKGLHTFIETDIKSEDIITNLREGDYSKFILFDNFKVYKDGEKLGVISPDVLANAKTVN
jgi:hypothetical protein